MIRHGRTLLVVFCGTIAMAGMVASTTDDLGPLTAVAIPGWMQIPGVIAIGFLIGLALRSAAAAMIVLLTTAILGGVMQGLAIALAGFEIERAATHLINRGTVQGFYAMLVIFFIGMVGVVAALLFNVFARRIDV